MDLQTRELAFLITGLACGGAERQLVSLARNLQNRGWRILVISMLPPESLRNELIAEGIPVESLNMRRGVPDIRAAVRLAAILRHWNAPVLTSFMYHANLLARVSGHMANIPIIVTSIRSENLGSSWRNLLERSTGWMSDVTTTNSEKVGKNLVKRRIVAGHRMRVIPNGVRISDFDVPESIGIQKRSEIGLLPEEFIWLAIGRLEEPKDYPNLLKAFSIAVRTSPCRLLIAGEGPLAEDLERLAKANTLQEKVLFLGLRHDIPDLLKAADALVLSSAWEGMPNSVMEALSARRPVVATCVGGAPELVNDGCSGFLVEPRNPSALAEAMIQLMTLEPQLRRDMGEAGRRFIEANYDSRMITDKWETLYLELVRAKERKGCS